MLTGRLQVTTTYANELFRAVAEIVSGTCPRPIFLYRNHGETEELTEFIGVCDLSQLTSVPQWEVGVASPTFGVPMVRHIQAIQTFHTEEEVDIWTATLRRDIKDLMLTVDNTAPTVAFFDL